MPGRGAASYGIQQGYLLFCGQDPHLFVLFPLEFYVLKRGLAQSVPLPGGVQDMPLTRQLFVYGRNTGPLLLPFGPVFLYQPGTTIGQPFPVALYLSMPFLLVPAAERATGRFGKGIVSSPPPS